MMNQLPDPKLQAMFDEMKEQVNNLVDMNDMPVIVRGVYKTNWMNMVPVMYQLLLKHDLSDLQPFKYKDENGNRIKLTAEQHTYNAQLKQLKLAMGVCKDDWTPIRVASFWKLDPDRSYASAKADPYAQHRV